MELTTKYNIGDTVYVLDGDELCLKGKVEELAVDVDEEGKIEIEYAVLKTIPHGLLTNKYKGDDYLEEDLYASKKEVKEKIAENKEEAELYEKLRLKHLVRNISAVNGFTWVNSNNN
tara:strand:+ start:7143 stop:7493 length:351 start_codon:yes stop_codon:yes gene_type:complete